MTKDKKFGSPYRFIPRIFERKSSTSSSGSDLKYFSDKEGEMPNQSMLGAVGGIGDEKTPLGTKPKIFKKSLSRDHSRNRSADNNHEHSDKEDNDRECVPNSIPYKHVISWFTHLKPDRKGFEVFSRTGDRAFKFITHREYDSLLQYVRNQAEGIGCDLSGVKCNTWATLRLAIAEFLGIRETQKSLWDELMSLKRERDEDIYCFFNRLVGKALRYVELVRRSTDDRAEIRVKSTLAEEHIRDLFVRSVDSPFNVVLSNSNPKSIQEAYKMQRELEIKLQVDRDNKDNKIDEVLDLIRELKVGKDVEAFSNPKINRNEVARLICQVCEKPGHSANDCWTLMRRMEGLSFGSNNHHQRSRRGRNHNSGSNNNQISYQQNSGQGQYQNGYRNDHGNFNNYGNNGGNRVYNQQYSNGNYNYNHNRNYPNQGSNNSYSHQPNNNYNRQDTRALPMPQERNDNANPRVNNVYNDDLNSGRNLFIYMNVKNINRKALLDTGSQLNLIRKSIADDHPKYIKEGIVIRGINGRSTTYGSLFLDICINGHWIKELFHIVDNNSLGKFDFYLGSKLFLDHRCCMDYDNMVLFNKYFSTRIYVEDVTFSLLFNLSGMDQKEAVSFVHNVFVCDDEEETYRYVDAEGLIGEDDLGDYELPSLNSEFNAVDVSDKFNLKHLGSDEVKAIGDILVYYSDVFADITPYNLPNLMFESLELKSTEKIQTKIYRFPPVHNQLVKEELQRLLKLGIITHSKSPFNSPVWIVPKKDGENGEKNYRIVIDYRKINNITIQDNFPLPNIADIIDQLGGAQYFSAMDLVSGYHQIALRPEDRYKTAFSALGGHYEFTRLPFGLINSAAGFQRIMMQVLEGLVGEICFVYIDDIVVYGSTFEVHNKNLSVVLQRLSKFKLKVKPSKCHFLKDKINYLGYVISREGVRMDEGKTLAIRNFVEPDNVKKLKSFLGLAGFYRKFIPNFSMIATALHKLLKKGINFEWDSACTSSFQTLIKCIEKDIVLAYPDFEKTFYLTTDASNFGIGAVISQKDGNGFDRPLAFASRALIPAEINYTTTEKECLAIVWGINEYKHYLTGRKFVVLSDHRPLVWLDSIKDPGARLMRWRLKLNNYNYEIRYTPGKSNYVADELSRNGFCNFMNDNPLFNEELLPSVFAVDAGIELEDEPVTDEEDFECMDFHPRVDREKIESDSVALELIKEQHCGAIGGHRGINATCKAIDLFFEVSGLRQKVIDFIKHCDICQRVKYERRNRTLPLSVTTTASEPNEKVAFDVIGPFKYPDGRKLYGLTIQDEFSKFILFCGIRNCTAEVIAKAFVEKWILYYGIPKFLLSDNGSNLCGEIMTNVAAYFNIKKITTSIAHPQSNASVERAHARLAEFVRATETEIEESTSWEDKLKMASYCYNSTVHATTGYTPYFLMFGRQARPISGLTRDVGLVPDSYLVKFDSNLKAVWRKARENIIKSKEVAMVRENKKVQRRVMDEFKVGDKVLVKVEVFKGRVNRTEPVWTGPFVIAQVNRDSVLIKKRNRQSLINKSRCKLYLEPSNPN